MRLLHPSRKAFTLLELLVVFAVIALLAVLVLPTWHRPATNAAMAGCASNMKNISLAFLVWLNDNPKGAPPWRVDVADGGTKNHASGLQNNLWFQYSWISNELLNPRVLACPSDKQAKPADTFTASAQGGFLNAGYQNEACSYNLGLDADFVRGGTTAGALVPDAYAQDGVLISDRNSNTKLSAKGSCSSGLNPVYGMNLGMKWLPKPNHGHGNVGNVGLRDGSVYKTSDKEFNEAIARSLDGRADVHCLQPRPNP